MANIPLYGQNKDGDALHKASNLTLPAPATVLMSISIVSADA